MTVEDLQRLFEADEDTAQRVLEAVRLVLDLGLNRYRGLLAVTQFDLLNRTGCSPDWTWLADQAALLYTEITNRRA